MNTIDQVGIYNMALAAVGVSQFVQSPDDGSLQARTCNVMWEACRDQCLQDFPWGFASRFAALQLISKITPGWLYTYGYPADCLQARVIVPAWMTITNASTFPATWLLNRDRSHKIPFTVVENEAEGGLGIACNEGTPTLGYTARVTTPALWSPAFANALSWLLATRIIAPLSANPQYAITAGQAYQVALIRAGAQSMNEVQSKEEPESELIRVRG